MKCIAVWYQRGGNSMKAERMRLNSRGSSLIVVVIGAAFLGILGALILSITYTNINLKTADNLSKKNFYTDEVVVNELTAKLEETSAACMTKAYGWMVKNYQKEAVDTTKFYKEYKKQYMIALSQTLNKSSDTTDVATEYKVSYLRDLVTSFSKSASDANYIKIDLASPGANPDLGTLEFSKDTSGNINYDSLTIKNVSITYNDRNNYETTIVTDINMEFPTAGGVDTSFAKYALISDQLIKCDAVVNVTGGVYAGETDASDSGVGDSINPDVGGILVEDTYGDLNIDGKGNIVATRGNITAYSYGKLTINNAKVWAKNILTFGPGREFDFSPYIHINGITKVQDDLIMKAAHSTIKLDNSYYGFSYESKDGLGERTTADRSSAITINAKDVSLDTTGLENLVLFGRAFVSSSSTDNADAEKTEDVMMDVMTGQSIGVKYDQGVYLVPHGSFLKIKSNPIDVNTLQDYARPLHEHDADFDIDAPHVNLDMDKDIVDLTKGEGAEIKKYLDLDMPVRPIYYKQGTGEDAPQMANFYWNFKDEQSANDYFAWYYSKHPRELEKSFKQFYRKNGDKYNLLFKPGAFSRLQIASDVLYQNPDSGAFQIEKGIFSESRKESIREESAQMTTAYQSVCLNLREDGDATKKVKDNEYVDRHFNLKEIEDNPIELSVPGIRATRNNREAKVYITNQDTFEVKTAMAGIVLASGDVKVTADFDGVIIANGKILLAGASSIYADEKMVLDILSYFQANGNELKKYIYGYDNASKGAAGDDSMDFGKAISFENWKKNA